jgi:hypothetical protein
LQHRKVIGQLQARLVGVVAILAAAFTSAVPAAQASTCTLQAIPLSAPALPPELVKRAGSYFHPGDRGYFQDLIEEPRRFAYYDPAQPFSRVVPPDSLYMAYFNTENYIVGYGFPTSSRVVSVNKTSRNSDLLQGDTPLVNDVVETWIYSPSPVVIVNKTSGNANVWGDQGDTLHMHDVVETPDKSLWILGTKVRRNPPDGSLVVVEEKQAGPMFPADGPLVLARGDKFLPLQTLGRGQRAGRFGMTRKGKLAAVWVERGSASDGKVALRMAWIDDRGNAQPAIDVDLVKLPPSYADLSVRTGTNLVVAPYGDKLVIAWRPLLAPFGVPVDTGRPSTFSAAVRMIVVAPGKKPRLIAQHPTKVYPVDFVRGPPDGPWPLDRGDALSISLNGEPVFLWLEATDLFQQSLVAARVNDARPATLVADSFDTLWVPASSSGGKSVVMNAYRSSPEFRRFEIGCKDEKASPRDSARSLPARR